jgi:hypothetical protein
MTTRLSIFQDPVEITNLNANFAQRSYLWHIFSVIRRHLRGFRGHKMTPDANSLSAAFMGYAGLAAQPPYSGKTTIEVKVG